MSMIVGLMNPVKGFMGKVPYIYLVSFMAVFITFLLAKLIGAPGETLFFFAYHLMMVEIFGGPVALIIVVSFFANLLMPNLILPLIEFLFGLLVSALNVLPQLFFGDTFFSNPFVGMWRYWRPMYPELYVDLLLDAIATLKIGLDAI